MLIQALLKNPSKYMDCKTPLYPISPEGNPWLMVVIKLISQMLEPDASHRPSAYYCSQAISEIIRYEQNKQYLQRENLTPSAMSVFPHTQRKSNNMPVDPGPVGRDSEWKGSHSPVLAKKGGPETLPSFATIMQMDAADFPRAETKPPEQPDSIRNMAVLQGLSPHTSPSLSIGVHSSSFEQKGAKPTIKVNSKDIEAPPKKAPHWFEIPETPKATGTQRYPLETPQFNAVGHRKIIYPETGNIPTGSLIPFKAKQHRGEVDLLSDPNSRKEPYTQNGTLVRDSHQNHHYRNIETDLLEEEFQSCIPTHNILGEAGLHTQTFLKVELPSKTASHLKSPLSLPLNQAWSSTTLNSQMKDASNLRSKGSLILPIWLPDETPQQE